MKTLILVLHMISGATINIERSDDVREITKMINDKNSFHLWDPYLKYKSAVCTFKDVELCINLNCVRHVEKKWGYNHGK